MKTPLLLAGFLIAATAIGAAVARDAAPLDRAASDREVAADGAERGPTLRLAESDHDQDGDRHGRRHHRHHDDHDDDDGRGDHRDGRTARTPATGPSDPATPVPDNGLFQGKARPKVEVN